MDSVTQYTDIPLKKSTELFITSLSSESYVYNENIPFHRAIHPFIDGQTVIVNNKNDYLIIKYDEHILPVFVVFLYDMKDHYTIFIDSKTDHDILREFLEHISPLDLSYDIRVKGHSLSDIEKLFEKETVRSLTEV